MATTFDTVLKGAAVTLSGGNLTATVSAGTGSVKASTKCSGLLYFEMVTGATLSGSCRIGIAAGTFVLTGLPGNDTSNLSVGYDTTGIVKINNVTVATIATYTTSTNIGVAINTTLGLIWFRPAGGNWNNDVIGNQNPATNTGGITYSAVVGSLNPIWGGSATSSATAKFSAASWTFAAPSGYSTIETFQSFGTDADTTFGPVIKSTVVATQVRFIATVVTNSNPGPIPGVAVLPPGTVGIAYTETVTAQGGTSPYTYAVTSGTLPAGLSLNSSTGVISGTPTTVSSNSFTITVTDATTTTGTQAYTLAVVAPTLANFGFAS